MIADYIGSTSALLNYTKTDNCSSFIIATEPGIIHQMKKENPGKKFIPAPPKDSTCACSECNFMKLITVEKIYRCMLTGEPEIKLDENVIKAAYKPIKRMLDISAQFKKEKSN
jgi:quinolinate synthase